MFFEGILKTQPFCNLLVYIHFGRGIPGTQQLFSQQSQQTQRLPFAHSALYRIAARRMLSLAGQTENGNRKMSMWWIGKICLKDCEDVLEISPDSNTLPHPKWTNSVEHCTKIGLRFIMQNRFENIHVFRLKAGFLNTYEKGLQSQLAGGFPYLLVVQNYDYPLFGNDFLTNVRVMGALRRMCTENMDPGLLRNEVMLTKDDKGFVCRWYSLKHGLSILSIITSGIHWLLGL